MAKDLKLGFAPFRAPSKGILIVFCDDTLKVGAATRKILGKAADQLPAAAASEHFTGKSGATLDIVLPADLKAGRLTVIGAGKTEGPKSKDFLRLGGVAAGKLPDQGGEAMAQYHMGVFLSEGKLLPPDAAEAASWYRRAAAQGLPMAMHNLAWRYLQGVGLDVDLQQALALFRQAAAAGQAESGPMIQYLEALIPPDA